LFDEVGHNFFTGDNRLRIQGFHKLTVWGSETNVTIGSADIARKSDLNPRVFGRHAHKTNDAIIQRIVKTARQIFIDLEKQSVTS
jgi:hypothetical protein